MKPYHLSKQTGLPAGLVSDYVNGKKKPSIENLVKIADFLGVSVDFLLGRPEQKAESGLSDIEHRLIAAFRQLDRIQQENVVTRAEVLAEGNACAEGA